MMSELRFISIFHLLTLVLYVGSLTVRRRSGRTGCPLVKSIEGISRKSRSRSCAERLVIDD